MEDEVIGVETPNPRGDYTWQDDLPEIWKKNKWKGVIKAVTAAGKTRAARKCLEFYFQHFPNAKVIIVSPSKTILQQDYEEFQLMPNEFKKNLNFITLQTIWKYHDTCDLLIIDEVHRAGSPKFGQIWQNLTYKHKLSMSCVPDGVLDNAGKILVDVGYDKARICDFEVHPVFFTMPDSNVLLYEQQTKKIRNLYRTPIEAFDGKTYEEKSNNKKMACRLANINRRNTVFNCDERLTFGYDILVEQLEKGKKIAVFSERIDQLKLFGKMLEVSEPPIPYSMFITKMKKKIGIQQMKDFQDGKVKVLLSVRKVTEGWNDVDLDCEIFLSKNLSKIHTIQTIGRAIRYKEGKKADIFLILASGTTDMKLLDEETVIAAGDINQLEKEYFAGFTLVFEKEGKIYKNTNSGKVYYKCDNPELVPELKKHIPDGGMFKVFGFKVLAQSMIYNRITVIKTECRFVPVGEEWVHMMYSKEEDEDSANEEDE